MSAFTLSFSQIQAQTLLFSLFITTEKRGSSLSDVGIWACSTIDYGTRRKPQKGKPDDLSIILFGVFAGGVAAIRMGDQHT